MSKPVENKECGADLPLCLTDDMVNVKKEFDEKGGKETCDDIEMKQEIITKNEELEKSEEMKIKEEIEIKDEMIESIPDETSETKESCYIKDEEATDNNENESEEKESESVENESESEEKESESEEEEIEYPYVKAIKQILGIVARPGTFACGGNLEKAKLDLTVGDLKIKFPLSKNQGEVLKSKATKAPFGRGSKTLRDNSVRDAWQVDAKDVILDEEFNTLIKEKVSDIMPSMMGESYTDNEHVDLELYKLVYYEKDGHFLSHRDTEKAPGMFATLVIQLPAGHSGGALVIRHKGETKVFDFEDDSRDFEDESEYEGTDNYFFTAFYSDCEHELRKITGGQRLVLIYNLFRKNPHPSLNPSNNDILPCSNENLMTTMQNSVEEWQSDTMGPQYLALKLDHLYTNTNTSFQNLKGKDMNLADALRSCESIVVYLATLIKHEKRCGYNDDPDPYEDKPDLVPEDEVETECTYILQDWIGVDNKKQPFGKLELHKNEMLLKEEYMFLKYEERCKSEYEYTGNEGCKIDYFYKKKALVFLPKSHEILISCDANLADMIAKCKKLSVSKRDEALCILKGIILYIEKRHEKAMGQLKKIDKVADIFEIMISLDDTAKSLANTFLLTLTKKYEVDDYYIWSTRKKNVGLPNIKSAIALSNMIKKFSWDTLGNSALTLVKECAVSHTVSCAQLISSLLSLGLQEQAVSVVEVAAPLIIAKIKSLDSDFGAVWTVLLASHDIFSDFFDDFVKQIPKMGNYKMIEVITKMHKSLKKNILNQSRIIQTFQTLLGILQDNSWKGLSLKYVTLLWPVVIFVDKLDCDDSVLQPFVKALIENENSSDFLKESLKLNMVHKEKDNTSVQLMVEKRLHQLQIPYPAFSWAQPNAEVEMSFTYFGGPDLEKVNKFLRSGEKSKTFSGDDIFYDKADAFMFGFEYFRNGEYNKTGKYSAKFELSGKDSNVKCKLIKTKNYMDEKVKEYNSMCEEAKVLKKKFSEPKKALPKKRAHE